jgi:Helix-turn-helix domain of resolvase
MPATSSPSSPHGRSRTASADQCTTPPTRSADYEFESDLIKMRTREGMKVARAKGRLRGKQPKLSPRQEAHLVALYAAGGHTISELEELFSITRSTVYGPSPAPTPAPQLSVGRAADGAHLAVDPGRACRGRRTCRSLAPPREDLRRRPQPHLRRAGHRNRRRVRPLGPSAPAPLHPHRRHPDRPPRLGRRRRLGHGITAGRWASAHPGPAAWGRAVRLHLRPGR